MNVHSNNAARALADAHALAFPRYPGTEGDRRAIERVAGRLREAGLEVSVEPFSYDLRPALRATRAVLLVTALLVTAGGLLSRQSAWWALAPLALGFAIGGVLLVWAPWSAKIYGRPGPTETANVAGHHGPAAPRLSLILMAHHDSKSQSLTFPWRMGMTLMAIGGALVLLASLLTALARGEPAAGWWPLAGGGAAALALVVLSTMTSGNRSPGGVDNAGSVGIVLELARLLPAAVPDDVELIFLSPGAEEDHMVGAMRWLDAHRDELARKNVWALNFDGAGNQGRIALLERFGFGRWFSQPLSAIARSQAERLDIMVRGVLMPPAMGIDAIPFAHRGIDCLTFSSGSLNRATLAVHSAGDVAELLDRDTLRRATQLGAAVAEALAAEADRL